MVMKSQNMNILFCPAGVSPETVHFRKIEPSEPDGSIEFSDRNGRWIASYVNLNPPGITVLKIGSYDEFVSEAERTSMITLIITIIATCLVASVIVFFTGRTTGSLRTVTKAAEDISLGNLDQDVRIKSKDEIKILADSFNMMTVKLKTMIREVQRSRSMAAIGQFASNIAHEIRNPLTSIKMNLQMLKRNKNLSEKEKNQLNLCLDEVNRLSRVVKGTLKLAKTAVVEFKIFSVTEIISRALRILEKQFEEKKIVIRKEFQKDLPEIECNDINLEEVFINIFLNAADAVKTGGTLIVKSRQLSEKNRDFAEIEISDNGAGIPEEKIDSIFEPFYTTKEDGIGLGLSIAVGIVEQHKGRIHVESEINKGTTFKIVLPVRQ